VYWASAPGYVGWCPLGWDNRPVFSIININVNVRRGYDPYSAWTVVPRNAFGTRPVTRYAVPRNALRTAVPRWTVESASAPVRPAVSARTATPIYSAGRADAPTRTAPDMATPRSDRSAVSRGNDAGTAAVTSRTGSLPRAVPRTSAAQAPGVLGRTGSAETSRATSRARPRYRDLGPGGASPPAAPEVPPDTARTPLQQRGVPGRRQPDSIETPRYSPPRSSLPDAGNRATPRYPSSAGEDRAPMRREPRGDDRPAGSVSRQSGGDESRGAQPRYRPPSASPAPSRPMGAPSRSAPGQMSRPSPRPDGARAPSRSAPSGESRKPSSDSGDAPRARPRPQPK
jgi:hypothetical protein